MSEAFQSLAEEIAHVEFNAMDRGAQKALLENWSQKMIEAFRIEPPEQWRVICLGEAIQATLCGLYGLACAMLSDAIGLADDVSPAFMNSISDREREIYTLEKLPGYLEFVRSFPFQPHPIFGFRKPGEPAGD